MVWEGDDLDEKADSANRLGKGIGLNRLRHVNAATERIAEVDFARVVACGQKDHGSRRRHHAE